MSAPSARFQIGDTHIHLLGTVAGFVPDGERVHVAIGQDEPAAIAFAVPEQDLTVLDLLAEKPELAEDMALPDDLEERRLEGLAKYGATQIPSPDIVAAHREARRHSIALCPVDLDDIEHTHLYTKLVSFRHVIQANGARNKLRKQLPDGADAYDFQRSWEQTLLRSKGQRKLEQARVERIVKGIREAAGQHKRIVAVVPAFHFDAILAQLRTSG